MMKKFVLAVLGLLFTIVGYAAAVDSTFTVDGPQGKLAARVELPEIKKGEKIPMVIYCHGLGGQSDNPFSRLIADSLLNEGIGIVLFDFDGHGKSEGRFQDMTVQLCIEDMKRMVEWTEKQPYTKSISLIGHSLGGLVNAVGAGQLGNRIASNILLAPGGVARDVMLMGNFFGVQFDPWNVPEYIEIWGGKKLGRNYIEGARDMPIYEISRMYEGPTLVVNGTHDKIVPISYSERFAYELPNAELMRIEGDGHELNNSHEYLSGYMAKWIKRYNP